MGCDDEALLGGANLAVLGREVFQFGDVSPLGNGRFRLSRLMRGRAGTEWAASEHAVGEAFVLLGSGSVATVSLPAWVTGSEVTASALNLSGRKSATRTWLSAENLRPPSPVALCAEQRADGGLDVSWTRRSRLGFVWNDGLDVPLGESSERYRVTLSGAVTQKTFETGEPRLILLSQDAAAIGVGPMIVSVQQIGDHALSRPVSCELTI